MCELMGICFAHPITADVSVNDFAKRGQENPDGWGLAWYPDKSVAIVKEAVAWQSSKHTDFLQSYPELRARIYLGHVRHKTVGGEVTHADTHPFARELGGSEYCFAHNGTLSGFREAFPLRRFRPLGTTDSEHAFCHLLDEIDAQPGNLRSEESWSWLHGKLLTMNEHGRMNVLLSDGESLFCYRDMRGHKSLTWRWISEVSPRPAPLEDQDLKVELQGTDFNHGVVIATCPLSGSDWCNVGLGEMLVLRDGKLVWRRGATASIAKHAKVG